MREFIELKSDLDFVATGKRTKVIDPKNPNSVNPLPDVVLTTKERRKLDEDWRILKKGLEELKDPSTEDNLKKD